MRCGAWMGGVALAAAFLPLRGVVTEDTHVGWVEKIECTAEWRESDRAQPVKLDEKADRFRFLYPGESVRCVGAGSMRIQYYENLCTLTMKEYSCEEKPIPFPTKDHWFFVQGIASEANLEDAKVEKFGRVAGRKRAGLDALIFSPASNGVVRLTGFVVRWTPTATPGPVRLRLIDDDGNDLWRAENIAGPSGTFSSESLRKVLVQQLVPQRAGQLTLGLTQDDSAEMTVAFSLLSAEDEKALEAELAGCQTKQSLLRYACRAYSFETRRMWNDETAEYDAALALEPASRDLTIAAILIHLKIGDTNTVERLTAQLPSGTKIPN